MIEVDLIGRIRRAFHEDRRGIKTIAREFGVSRTTVRKVEGQRHGMGPTVRSSAPHRLQHLTGRIPMFEAALIERCADPGLPLAVVEAFLERAGSPDPLAIAVRAGHRVVAIPEPQTSEEAIELARRYVGLAHVRVGLTQLPAGLGMQDPADLSAELFDACANLTRGTGLFGRIYRVVVRAHGGATDEALNAAIDAWRTGSFEGASAFGAREDWTEEEGESAHGNEGASEAGDVPLPDNEVESAADPHAAGIRIDLSRIGRD